MLPLDQFTQVCPWVNTAIMPVTENQLYAIRSDRMDFGNAQPLRLDMDVLSLQPERLALRALALFTQENVSESLLPAIAPDYIQRASADLIGDGLDSHHAVSAGSGFMERIKTK